MQTRPKIGEKIYYETIVKETDLASFENEVVHSVYSTFALARDAEYCGRLFVLKYKSQDEEGVGTSIEITHKSPALLGERVKFIATVVEVNEIDLLCYFRAETEEGRVIAEGKTGQKILPIAIIRSNFEKLNKSEE